MAEPVVLTVRVELDADMVGLFEDWGGDDDLEMVAMALAVEYHVGALVLDFTDCGRSDNWSATFAYEDRETPWPT